MITIATVLKSGGEYNASHVRALKNNLDNVLPKEGWRFAVLTDTPEAFKRDKGIHAHGLIHHWPGWWAKMEMFNPFHKLAVKGPCLYMDLDTVVTGNCLRLAEENPQAGFVMIQGWKREKWGSGLMRWTTPEQVAFLYDTFLHNATRWMNRAGRLGDQWVIGEICTAYHKEPTTFEVLWPNAVVSYKWHLRDRKGPTPEDCHIVVCFHGNPRPWAIPLPWAEVLRKTPFCAPTGVANGNV